MYQDKLAGALEAVLFAGGTPMTVAELASIMQLEKPQIWQLLSVLEHDYANEGRGLMLRETGEGWQLVTKPEYYNLLENLGLKKEIKLTNASMETLAIIAYKQPVTRAEIEAIRGVKVDGVINTLLDLELIEEAGRKKAIGNPILFVTTKKFLTVFGLKDSKELPTINSLTDDKITEVQQVLPLDGTTKV